MVSDFERRDPASRPAFPAFPSSTTGRLQAAGPRNRRPKVMMRCTQYWIPGAGQMTWSGLPPIRSGRVFGGVATPVQQLDSAELSQWHTRRRHLDEQPVHIHRRCASRHRWRRADSSPKRPAPRRRARPLGLPNETPPRRVEPESYDRASGRSSPPAISRATSSVTAATVSRALEPLSPCGRPAPRELICVLLNSMPWTTSRCHMNYGRR